MRVDQAYADEVISAVREEVRAWGDPRFVRNPPAFITRLVNSLAGGQELTPGQREYVAQALQRARYQRNPSALLDIAISRYAF
jgi:hypothetical protein